MTEAVGEQRAVLRVRPRVLVLAELEEQTVPAIAELEGIPVGTAASRLRRARAMFGELLERDSARNPFGGDEP